METTSAATDVGEFLAAALSDVMTVAQFVDAVCRLRMRGLSAELGAGLLEQGTSASPLVAQLSAASTVQIAEVNARWLDLPKTLPTKENR